MADFWRRLGRLAAERGPGLLRDVLDPVPTRPRPSPVPGPPPVPPGARAPGRSRTADRARRIEYAPDLDGAADPGEVVSTWVPYEEDASRGKDRPVLVVGRDGRSVLGLMLSSRDHDGDPDWLALGRGAWDREHRDSWVRLDRVLEVDEDGIRREGAILDRAGFDRVADRLRSAHGWR